MFSVADAVERRMRALAEKREARFLLGACYSDFKDTPHHYMDRMGATRMKSITKHMHGKPPDPRDVSTPFTDSLLAEYDEDQERLRKRVASKLGSRGPVTLFSFLLLGSAPEPPAASGPSLELLQLVRFVC